MPRSASPDATVASEAWFIPAPAPCARTRQAWAPSGCISRPETLRPELTSKLRGRSSFMAVRSQPDGTPDVTRDPRPLLIVDGDSFAHRAYHGLPTTIRRAGDKGGGAIFGFANTLLRLYAEERPRAVLVGWDTL